MLQACRIIEEFRKLNVTHVLTVPDNSSKALLERLSDESGIQMIPVTREGEAFAIAAGLWVGDKTPVVVAQNTGFLESGDAVRGTVMRMRVPLLCLITYRGYKSLNSLGSPAPALNAELLGRPDVDSIAVLTEPTLKAWGIPFDYLQEDSELDKIPIGFEQAQEQEQPVALLVTAETC